MTIQRLGTTARYSDIVIHNQTAWIVEVPASTEGDIETQTLEVLNSLDRLLEQAGSSREHILMATIYLTSMSDYDGMNTVWDSWLPAACAPSRACVQVSALANPGWRVEIALVAAIRTAI